MDSRAGVEFPDPYHWLEENSDEVREWQRAQAEIASNHVQAWPHFEALGRSVERYSVGSQSALPRFAGGRWFTLGDGKVRVSETPQGPGRAIYDASQEREGNPDVPAVISWISPSPDGRKVALGVCTDGSERNTIRLVDAESTALDSRAPPQPLMDAWTGGVTWLKDSSGFFFEGLVGAAENVSKQVYLHRLDTGEQTPMDIPETRSKGAGGADWTLVTVARDGRYAVANRPMLNSRPVAVKDLRKPDSAWRPFVTDIEATIAGYPVGDRFIAVTSVGAPRGRVVAIALDSSTPNDPSTWSELVPESQAVIRSIVPVGECLYLSELVDTYARVRILYPDGSLREMPLPGRGVIEEQPFPLMNLVDKGHPNEYLFSFSTLSSSMGVYRHRPGEADIEVLQAPQVVLEGTLVEDHWAVSADGTRVPYHSIRLQGVDASKPLPTLINAYGGFNAVWSPSFPGPMAAFIAAGGVFVNANIRGGGEFGLEWWEGGRQKNKQNCYADLYAVAEHLIARGVTNSDKLAFVGLSNGGLMAGVITVQRPDLWKAVVPRVPLFDLIGALRDAYGMMTIRTEYANPDDPEEVRRLAEFSPYHLVKDGARYPAVFIDSGDTDPRCPPWHARKWAARLQTAQGGEAPILLRVYEKAGHGGWATERGIQQLRDTEWLAFVMQQLGMVVQGT